MGAPSAADVAERAARQSYGRLLAILSAGTRDLTLAEEALAEAFARALKFWPRQGVPENPEGWLLTVARNGVSNLYRRDRTRAAATEELILRAEERADHIAQADERLSLMFVCAHPAIDPAARTPLMLQTVLGLDAARIAAAFLVPPATMGQRLVRAKARIKELRLRFALPEADDLPGRLADVLEAIYGAFGADWDGAEGSGLPDEAIHLARVLRTLMPEEPEVNGLLALMLYIHARRAARKGEVFVPLSEQDAALWDRDQVIEAEGLLTQASRAGRFGRFQCEAAIQSVHAQRAISGRLNLEALDTLHDLLARHHPTVGGTVAHAAVRRMKGDTTGALAMLDLLPESARASYQPALVLRAHCLRDLGDPAAARAAVEAVAATGDTRVRDHLRHVFGPGPQT
jgi:RNA polymerase sigma-70 factor (ECF subfamily)